MAKLWGKELSKKEILQRVGNLSQLVSVKSYTMDSGRSDGVKAIQVTNGSGLDFTVLEDKCLDIAEIKFKGVNLSFVTKPGIVAPEFFNPDSMEFLRTFQGGALYTCGLSNVGSGCTENGTTYGLHGRIGHIPAENTGVNSYWKGDEYFIDIYGEMRQAALFSENLVLRRLISTKAGSKSFKIHDVVENQGFEEQPLMLLYHFNLGYPLLDEYSKFLLPGCETAPRDEEAKKGIAEYDSFIAPLDRFNEQVFYHKAASDENYDTCAGLINESINLGIYIRYNTRQLPRLIQWKSMKSGDYVLGIEPSNCLVEGRVKERERGTLESIPPMAERVFDLEFGVLEGASEIESFKKEIEILKNQN